MTAVPNIKGGLSISSGTSFSCPHTAGAAALIKHAHPDVTPNDIINRLATTARPLAMVTGAGRTVQDYLAPVFLQGGGLIDVWAAVHTTTLLNVSNLAFNDTAHLRPLAFEITNIDSNPVVYEITNTPGPSQYTFVPGEDRPTNGWDDTAFLANFIPTAHAKLTFSNTSVTIDPARSAVITVTVTEPKDLDVKRLPLYSGLINIRGSDNKTLSLPYGGIAANLRDFAPLSSASNWRPLVIARSPGEEDFVVPGSRTGINMTTNFTLLRTNGSITNPSLLLNITLPGYFAQAAFGTRRIDVSLLQDSVDLGPIRREPVEPNTIMPPRWFSRDACQGAFCWNNGGWAVCGQRNISIQATSVKNRW